ncbi:MAG: isochorismatase family protein [Candidatus Phlomobacter fragariae]
MTHTALLLVDLQNDFCNGGALEVLDSESVINTANDVITYCQQQGICYYCQPRLASCFCRQLRNLSRHRR